MTQNTWRSETTAPKMPKGSDRAESMKIALNERLWSIGSPFKRPDVRSLTTNKSPFWHEPKVSTYLKDLEKYNQIDTALGQPNDFSINYEPYKNRRSLFQEDLHLKKRKELTGVTLPALEHMFQKDVTDSNFLMY